MTAADVERVLARDVAARDLPEARRLLEAIRAACGRETARVQLAALKLSAGRIDRLRHWAHEAEMDWRDVLAPAEYPRACRLPAPLGSLPRDVQRAVYDEDWRQYESWLRRT